ncbi:DNA cytosine methyltransferase [Candidatus Tokpelaia sp.]|uniref:DNA cytosine methyltransferase n=1 Tax=Candidatus Tokpelaia sp. TaxID=2233777 RepID=UPI00123ABCDD|nr:DNA cytosine methyltransferase [Candidatus Tokpelaia sp.]KAA6405803.1 DNA cytosine methyltransferase [Candidatus Tokpelaia sp.]
MTSSNSLKVIDIFAGPGGLGEGFAAYEENGKNPFNLSLSIEKDPAAHSTLLMRSFYRQFGADNIPDDYWHYLKGGITRDKLFENFPRQRAMARDEARCIELGKAPHKEVKALISSKLQDSKKWVLVGGPPCQAYSLVGRARMNSNPDFENDERHFLYREYLKILADHRPPVFVMENVKGMLSAQHGGKRIIEPIMNNLRQPGLALTGRRNGLGYNLFSLVDDNENDEIDPTAFLVRAEDYGIPQARHRVLILGIRDDIDITPERLSKNEAPSVLDTISDLPRIRSTLSREADSFTAWKNRLFEVTGSKWYISGRANGLYHTVQKIDQALSILSNGELTPGAETLKYKGKPKVYSKWYRNGCDGVVTSHAGRGHMLSDLHRYLFASSYAMANGKSAQLVDFPATLLPAHRNVQNGVSKDYFGDRFRVQVKDRPSTTITSHISKDGHYFIHYDPSQCRSLTVREAARLQTFPDSYKFEGNRTSQYHQVGNAVPPLLSVQIAEIVYDILKRVRIDG